MRPGRDQSQLLLGLRTLIAECFAAPDRGFSLAVVGVTEHPERVRVEARFNRRPTYDSAQLGRKLNRQENSGDTEFTGSFHGRPLSLCLVWPRETPDAATEAKS